MVPCSKCFTVRGQLMMCGHGAERIYLVYKLYGAQMGMGYFRGVG